MTDSGNHEVDIDIQSVRSRLLDKGLIIFAVVVPLATAMGLILHFVRGGIWRPSYFVDIVVGVVILFAAMFKARLPYVTRAIIFIGTWFAMGTSWLYGYGMVGGGAFALIVAVLFTALAFGPMAGLVANAISLGIIIFISLMVSAGMITFLIDINMYATSMRGWGFVWVAFIFFLPLIIICIRVLYDYLLSSVKSLRESEINYREIFNSPSDAIFVHNAKTGLVLDVNQAMLGMYDYEKEDVVGKTVNHLSSGIPPYDESHARTKIEKAIEEGPQIFEWQAKKKSGELFWVEVTLKYSHIGDEERILAVVRDITERKKSLEMMIQSEKMMSVGGLAAGMAHEINNPLAGIMQSAEVLQMRLSSSSRKVNQDAAKDAGTTMEAIEAFMASRGVLDTLHNIQDAVGRASTIVANVLSFARKSDTPNTRQSIADLMDQTVHIASSDYDLKKKFDFRHITIVREYDTALPAVPCEPSMMQQVFLNLLRNAAEAMQEGAFNERKPTITLRLAHEPETESVRIELEDNGPGMDEATRKRVFEPFFTTKPPDVGTGLGLSVSYFIITEHHGGKMRVESVLGKSTKFVIHLPLHVTA